MKKTDEINKIQKSTWLFGSVWIAGLIAEGVLDQFWFGLLSEVEVPLEIFTVSLTSW